MLQETGRVVAIESDALWVETVQRSTCDSCRAQNGCGQRVLGEALSSASRLRVVVGGRPVDQYKVGQQVVIGIPEHVVVLGSLGVYLLPLLCLVGAALLASAVDASEGLVALSGGAGLLTGGLLVRLHSRCYRNSPDIQPVLL